MINKIFDMTVQGSMGAPTLTTYLLDTPEGVLIRERPIVLICPGGGYNHVSVREGEPLALQFMAMGFHAAVLNYSVSPAVYPTQLLELAKAVALLRDRAQEWHIRKDGLFIQGSSAGGHLAASFGCFWKKELFAKEAGDDAEKLRPNGLILSYPVITSGEFAHRGSFEMLLGDRNEELARELSLEYQVNKDTPKTFLWHTFEDGAVPVENSLLFVQALRREKIPVEFHLFPSGGHGLALGNELTSMEEGKEIQPQVTAWIALAGNFIRNL